ncbi:MAG: phage holin family protein [Sphingomicrobium sp.]
MLKPAEPPLHPEPEPDRPVGELVSELVDHGKAYAAAEIDLAKAMAAAKVAIVKVPALLFGAAFLLLQAGFTVLGVALFLGLLPLIGPIFAGLVAFLIFAGLAAGLGWYAAGMIRKAL